MREKTCALLRSRRGPTPAMDVRPFPFCIYTSSSARTCSLVSGCASCIIKNRSEMVWRVVPALHPHPLMTRAKTDHLVDANKMVEHRSASQDCIHATDLDLSSRPTSSIRLSHFHFGNSCRVMAMMRGLAQDLPVTLALLTLPVYPK